MSKSKDSIQLDRSITLPAPRFSSLLQTNLTSVEMRALQSSVRKKREVVDNNNIENNEFDLET